MFGNIVGFRDARENGLEERGLSAGSSSVIRNSFDVHDGGLGSSVRGVAEPVTVVIKRTREGLGRSSEAPPISANTNSCEALLKDFRSIYSEFLSPCRTWKFLCICRCCCLIAIAGRVAELRRHSCTPYPS
jgi:hypothetical protein